MQDEYLTRCVVNPTKRSFKLISNLGEEKNVQCDTSDEFMNVLSFVRNTLNNREELVYIDPMM
jgi:hypothetical protein